MALVPRRCSKEASTIAVLYITEYAELEVGPVGRVGQMPMEPPLVQQTVAIGGASVQSAAVNAKTRFIRIHTAAICSTLTGTNPTATATNARMGAGQTEHRDVSAGTKSGTAFKIAVMTNT